MLYSAASRQAALDELGPDDASSTSVYTRVLIEKLRKPGLTLSQIAREVRVDVAALAVTVGRVQSPAYYDELNDEFIINPAEPISEPATSASPDDAEAFALAKSFNSIATWEAFLRTYTTGFYADLAKVALEELWEAEFGPIKPVTTVSQERGLETTFAFPVAGKVKSWEVHFVFETECENDYYSQVVSPTGRVLIVMDRGLRRCTGIPTVFTGESSDDIGAFVGSEAQGNWRFTFKDLDKNAHSGALRSAWMKLTVDKDGVVTEHRLTLDDLPREIPNPT